MITLFAIALALAFLGFSTSTFVLFKILTKKKLNEDF